MNASASFQPLIIGTGNPLRSDDGLGWVVIEQLSRDSRTNYDLHTAYQLTPELASILAQSSFVVVIDASRNGKPGELKTQPLSIHEPGLISTHSMTPEELVALTRAVYSRCPPVVLVTVAGADFSIGEQLSSIVAQLIPRVCELIHQICAERSQS